MKTILLGTLLGLAALEGAAQSLSFFNGYVYNDNTVQVGLQGPTNRWVALERLSYTTQTWSQVNSLQLSSSGYGFISITNGLAGGFYGIYRARYTNTVPTNTFTYSTNFFAGVAGSLPLGTSLIGNPFSGPSTNMFVSQFLRSPINAVDVYAYRSGSYVLLGSCLSGTWLSDGVMNPMEGVLVSNPGTNQIKYVASGIISSNTFNLSQPQGSSLWVAPLFKLQAPNTNAVARTYPQDYQRVDLLAAGLLGGLSQLPVPVPGSTNATQLSRLTNHVGGSLYSTAKLTSTGTNWLNASNVVVSIPLNLTEAFWLNLPTNRTWTIPARSFFP